MIVWDSQWNLSYEEELKHVKDGVDLVEKLTGKRAYGYNCNWLRRSKNTLKVLQELGFVYHIDDVSRDEPFNTIVNGKPFTTITYTLRNNDIVNIEGKKWTPDMFLSQLKREFDQLYIEGKSKRRMMSVSLHDRIGGQPSIVNVINEFIEYAKKHEHVEFMTKLDIANLIKDDKDTLVDNSEEIYNK